MNVIIKFGLFFVISEINALISSHTCGLSSLPVKQTDKCFVQTNHASIVGGRKVSYREFPWIVSIQKQNSFIKIFNDHICGGTIISNRWILTAAHCLTNEDVNTLSVYVGSENIEINGKRYWIEQYIMHDKYNISEDATSVDDIALIKTKEVIAMERDDKRYKVNTVCLPKAYRSVAKEKYAFLAGWGKTGVTSSGAATYSKKLMKITHHIIDSDQKECEKSKEEFCTVSTVSTSTDNICHRDSGGPVIVYDYYGNAVIIGVIVAYKSNDSPKPCDSGWGLSTKVSHYINWINDVATN